VRITMKPHHFNRFALHFALMGGAPALLLATGCSSVAHRPAAWLSEDDLQTCKAAALDAFAAGYTMHQRDENRPILIRVDDWRTPTITVFLPIRETLPAGLTYAYYQFQGREPFTGKSELSAYALRERQTLKLIENGITSWGTGPLTRKVKLVDQ
jgi:hypothetical protein